MLQKLNFKAKSGAVTALIGGNGSGKSTIYKILTGQLYSNTAEITING